MPTRDVGEAVGRVGSFVADKVSSAYEGSVAEGAFEDTKSFLGLERSDLDIPKLPSPLDSASSLPLPPLT